jgi:hypothetical protein
MNVKLLPRVALTTISLAMLALGQEAKAQTNFFENFESGLGGWTLVSGATLLDISVGTNKVPVGGNQAARMTNSSCRMSANQPSGLGITAQSFKFTYWFYDNSGTATRDFCEVRKYTGGNYNNGSLAQLLMIGKYNTVTLPGEIYDGTKYQGRMANGSPAGYFNLNAPGTPSRSTGWHRFDIERGQNSAFQTVLSFYVDGKLGRAWTNSNANGAWDSVILATGLGTTVGNAWYDGLQVVSGETYIAEDPQSQTVLVGDPASLSVSAIGDAGAISYQWRKNGTNLVGSTDATYSIAVSQFSDAGNYSVVASNVLDVKTSLVAVLTVNAPLRITLQPTNQVANPGSNVTFYAEATGNGNLSYQWKKNGTVIPSATQNQFTINGVTATDAASYTLYVTDDAGDAPVTSNPAVLTVNAAPVISPISNQTNVVGDTVLVAVSATDDISVQTAPFQAFETNAAGTRAMFCKPDFSGTTGSFVDKSGDAIITNVFPGTHLSSQVLKVTWNWTNSSASSWLRLTTASGGGNVNPNPIVSFTSALSFDIYADKSLKVAVGLRESNPTGPIGTDAGGSSAPIEFVGVSAGGTPPSGTNTLAAGAWTHIYLDLTNCGIGNFSSGNGALDSTTGKGTFEQLGFAPDVAGTTGNYTVYVDNFVSVPSNPLTFSLDTAPAGALIEPYTGIISWVPSASGVFPFTVRATDPLGLIGTQNFSVTVNSATPNQVPISYSFNGTTLTLTWTGSHTLQSALDVTGPYNDLPGPILTSPFTTNVTSGILSQFFRLKN